MDFWIYPDNLTHIFWLGGLWVLLSVTWASASVWIASDSEMIFGKSSWPLVSVCVGAVFFLVTIMWGLYTTPVFAVGFIAAFFFYTFSRDKKAPAQERILCVAFMKKVLIRLAGSLGIDDVESLLNRSMKQLASSKQDSSVVLLKKDGSPIDGQGKGNGASWFEGRTDRSGLI